jgi:hypothetical protein
MSSVAFDDAVAGYGALEAELDKLDAVDVEGLSTRECRDLLQRRQRVRRRLLAGDYPLINRLAQGASAEELGGKLSHVLADDLRIYRHDALRLVEEATDLGPRRALTGEPLAPRLEYTAAGQREGRVGAEHVGIIRTFLAHLPCWVDEAKRADAERDLAEAAGRHRPDELKQLADHIDLCLNPDGTFSDADRARRRGVVLGSQGPDGMSRLSGWVNPELRAGLEAVLAKWAAPGMCNPADENPVVDGAPGPEAIDADARSAAQRNHDALGAMVRATLMSGELGTHQGLPVTIVASAALEDLQAKTGVARTAGGSVLPITDVLRMAAHAYNYLLVFDKAKRCELYRGRSTRLATPAQRLVLYATERGCTRPGCDVPAQWCQVHHVTDWARGGPTDIDNVTLACGPDNRLVDDDGWTTRKNDRGDTEWIPPPNRDHGQRRSNTYFHPEKMLPDEDEFSG